MTEKHRQEWTERDFDSLSWHDNELYGIRLHNPYEKDDVFDLVLDIDHILKWTEHPDGSFSFVVAPAMLTFHCVDKLDCRFTLSYKEHITISHIDRENVVSMTGTDDGPRWFSWRVHLQPDAGPPGMISFEAMRFTQKLMKEPIVTFSQSLEDEDR